MPSSPGRDDRGAARLVLMAAAATSVAAALALRLAVVAGLPTGLRPSTLLALPVEGLVEVGALGIGLVASTWLALSAIVALGCVAAHRLGRRWAAGEAVLARVAPTVVRRLARSAVGLGVGTGLALAPSAALAADDGAAAQDSASPTAVVDLGWQSTGGEDVPGAAGTPGADGPTAEVADGSGPGAATTVPPERHAGGPADLVEEAGGLVDAGDASATSGADSGSDGGSDGEADAGAGITPAPAGDASVVARDLRGTQPADEGTVVVLRGDTLWDIAASHLAERGTPSPSDAEVLEEMTRWHQTNRDVVGADPDVILPGQVLRPPG